MIFVSCHCDCVLRAWHWPIKKKKYIACGSDNFKRGYVNTYNLFMDSMATSARLSKKGDSLMEMHLNGKDRSNGEDSISNHWPASFPKSIDFPGCRAGQSTPFLGICPVHTPSKFNAIKTDN